MDEKKRKAASKAAKLSLDQTDQRIQLLQDNVLPPYPHLLSVSKKHVVRTEYPNDHSNIFGFTSQREFEAMQYMTLITPTDGERGPFLETRGNWEGDMAALGPEPNSRSNSGTPAPQKTFANKVSFSAYRKNGFKAPSQASTPNIGAAPGHSRNASAASASMARGLSFEGPADVKTNGAGSQDGTAILERGSSRHIQAASVQASRASSAQEKSTPAINGTNSARVTSNPTSNPDPRHTTNGSVSVTRAQPLRSSATDSTSSGLQNTNSPPQSRTSNLVATNGLSSLKSTSRAVDNLESRPQERLQLVKDNVRTNSKDKSVKSSSLKSSEVILQSKETNKDVARKQQNDRPRPQNPLPCKPSPPSSDTPSSQRNEYLKRPFASTTNQPEKRFKLDKSGIPSGHSRTPSNSGANLPRKPDPSGLPTKPQTSAASKAAPSSKVGPLTLESASKRKPAPIRASPRAETPKDIPPLLSPLPSNLESSPPFEPLLTSSAPSNFSNVKRQHDVAENERARAAHKRKIEEDISPIKKRVKRSESPDTAPLRKEKFGGIPRLLSPDLPSVIERALDEVQEEKKKHQTVEERHEKVRQPGAKGVARKTVKPRTGKKRAPRALEASPDSVIDDEPSEAEEAAKESLIVKLKYRKKNVKNVNRILRLAPRPGLPAPGKPRAEPPVLKASAIPKDEESSEEDVPLAKASAIKKRPVTSSKPEPQSKGGKKKNLEAAPTSAPTSAPAKKTTPVPSIRHESPAPSAPSTKNLLATPKKGDALKGVAMRRVDSSEALSRTPQPATTSTPSSISRSTMSDSRLTNSELEKLRTDQMNCGSLALKLKRKMDEILKSKINPRPEISSKDKKLGIATGLEAMVLYMNSHVLVDRLKTANRSEGWIQVLSLMNWLASESRDLSVLHALLLQLSALSKEFLERNYVDPNNKEPKDDLLIKIARNSISRTNDWIEAEKNKSVLEPFGGASILGPGSDIKDITAYAVGVITAYSRKEQTGWRKDPEFASVLS